MAKKSEQKAASEDLEVPVETVADAPAEDQAPEQAPPAEAGPAEEAVIDAPAEPSGEERRVVEAQAALAKQRKDVLRRYKGKKRGEVPNMPGTRVFERPQKDAPPEEAVLVDYRPEG